MKKLQIFEPAMCCPTGLCGVGVDPELLRVSTVLDVLDKKGTKVERYNLSSAPQVFVTNKVINQFIRDNGVEGLPVVILDDVIVLTGRYPKNEEFIALLDLPIDSIGEAELTAADVSEGCCCSGESVQETINAASGCSCSDETEQETPDTSCGCGSSEEFEQKTTDKSCGCGCSEEPEQKTTDKSCGCGCSEESEQKTTDKSCGCGCSEEPEQKTTDKSCGCGCSEGCCC